MRQRLCLCLSPFSFLEIPGAKARDGSATDALFGSPCGAQDGRLGQRHGDNLRVNNP
jgi:hypothetical protein